MPSVLLFPILLWVSVRCRPFFAAAGAFLVCFNIVWMTVFGVGYFGDSAFSLADRIERAQANMLVVAIGALVLAVLFAERRENEAHLAHANTLLERERERLARANAMLERERDNKLMNLQAALASIAHEVRQPLAAIEINSHAARRWLGRTPPEYEEVRASLDRIASNSQRTNEVFEALRALFGKAGQARQPIDVNEIILGVLQSFDGDLKSHGVTARTDLTSGLPPANGHKGQLREVLSNLVSNAIEAMTATSNRSRVLAVKTDLRDGDAIVVSVQDSGPGIDPERLDGIFGVFVSTKEHGSGLGLAICRMIIEQHGGQLSASSDGKSGALFQFVLPIAGGQSNLDLSQVNGARPSRLS
jgi:signal transduction histidine kinase